MSNYTDTLQRGDKIGCYRIEEVLGRGGFAVTYLATDENLDVEVAIKEYLPREITQRGADLQVTARKPEFVEDYDIGLQNFAREAKTLARFKHPHIVRVHQVLHANNTAYMVMDFERGQELAEIFEQRGHLPEEELRAILFPILDGVQEIHRHGFLHRDIKPSNIYVRDNGSPVLIDFGAARYTMSETTQQLTAVVTVGYTPIEQYNVSEDTQGPWSDIYALAAVCYEAVTGEVAIDSVTRASSSVTKGDDPLASVRNHSKGRYSDDCYDAIDWGLRMEAEDRPQAIAQWRDSFDGIFNPASAYVEQKDASIYSSNISAAAAAKKNQDHSNRAQRELQPPREPIREAAPAPRAGASDVVSIPLNTTETPLDAGVVSIDPNAGAGVAAGASAVSRIPAATRDTRLHESRNDNTQSANAGQQRNVLRDTQQPTPIDHGARATHTEVQKQRSKLERPADLAEAPRKRTLHAAHDEIEFDDTDWDYEPPTKSSPWKLVLPALGLAAVVGASVLYVNFPEVISNLGNKAPELTTNQNLALAQDKIESEQYIFPAGESAADYYATVLESEPDNVSARAGISFIEDTVRDQIAEEMENNNLSEANRLLLRADDAGLTGIYDTETAVASSNPTSNTISSNTATNSPVVTPTEETQITAVDTGAIEPVRTSTPVAVATASASQTQNLQPLPEQEIASPANTGIDNNLSPFIQGKISDIESLIEQERFAEARVAFEDADTFIADQSLSRRLLSSIENGEAAQAATLAANQAASQAATQVTTIATTQPDVTQPEQPVAQQTIVPEPRDEPQDNLVNNTVVLGTTQTQPAEPQTSVVSGNGSVAATGATGDFLNQLRRAIEGKDIDSVLAVSQPLTESRTQFLTRMFQRNDRLEVTIDDVNDTGNSLSATLNVSMYKRREDGSFYPAGKWNNVELNANRANGSWQKIAW